MSTVEACFFDLDKTTIDERGRLYDGLDTALDPGRRNFRMSILTARGFTRYQEAVKENPVLTPTYGMPVTLEAGGRIIDSEASQNLWYAPLSQAEQAAIFDFLARSSSLRYVAFHAKALQTKTHLWSPDEAEATRLHAAYSQNANVSTGSIDELLRDMQESEPCMVTCRSYSAPLADLPEGLQLYARGSTVNFLPHGVDKGVAMQTMLEMAGIAPPNVLAAGNDETDLPFLKLEGLGHPVTVGPDMTQRMLSELPDHAIHLELPQQLGNFVIERTV